MHIVLSDDETRRAKIHMNGILADDSGEKICSSYCDEYQRSGYCDYECNCADTNWDRGDCRVMPKPRSIVLGSGDAPDVKMTIAFFRVHRVALDTASISSLYEDLEI